MKTALLLLFLGLLSWPAGAEVGTPKLPEKIRTTADFREYLLATEWMWVNVQAKVPDRACDFVRDGTFRHANFVAKWTIKDIKTVELTRPGGKAILNFDADYQHFDCIDFNNKRITGYRK